MKRRGILLLSSWKVWVFLKVCRCRFLLLGERGTVMRTKCIAWKEKWNVSPPSCLKGISNHFISTNSLRVELFKSCFSVLHNGFKTTRLGMKLNISFLYLALEFLAEKWYLFSDVAIYCPFSNSLFFMCFSLDRMPLPSYWHRQWL